MPFSRTWKFVENEIFGHVFGQFVKFMIMVNKSSAERDLEKTGDQIRDENRKIQNYLT